MKVRPLEAKDFAQWLKLWEGYNTFYQRVISSEQTRYTFQRFIDANEMHALVVEDQQEIKGFVHYLFHANTATMSDVCYLQDLFTKEECRGQGIARRLMEEVYLKAQAEGSPRVYWLTHETNETAKKLYDKLATYTGFVVYRKNF